MLAVEQCSLSSASQNQCPNLLPCAIKHNGPVPISSRYWNPTGEAHCPENKASSTVYFRGRQLRSRVVKLPDRYEGLLLQKTEKRLVPQSVSNPLESSMLADGNGGMMEDEEDETTNVRLVEVKGKFDEIVVWGHEAIPEADQAFVRGIEEWIGFAEAMSSFGGRAQNASSNPDI